MLRLTEVRLPLDHAEAEIRPAILRILDIPESELVSHRVRRRGYDARKPRDVVFVYTFDVEIKNEATVLKRLANDRHFFAVSRLPFNSSFRSAASIICGSTSLSA